MGTAWSKVKPMTKALEVLSPYVYTSYGNGGYICIDINSEISWDLLPYQESCIIKEKA
jgi:hypothetical protein